MGVAEQTRARLRSLLMTEAVETPASMLDPLSARMAEEIGFKAGILGGSVAAMAVMGAPDIALITLSDLAEQTRRICRATTLPVIVDGDHGYGNALNVMRTVEEIAHAGAAAISIEDTLLPARFGAERAETISAAEFAGKIRAAVRAARESGIVIMARTTGGQSGGVDEALARCVRAEAEGADVLFLTEVTNLADLERVARATRLPIVVGGAKKVAPYEDLVPLRVRLLAKGHPAYLVGQAAVFAALRAEFGGGPTVEPGDLLRRYTRGDAFRDLAADVLKGD